MLAIADYIGIDSPAAAKVILREISQQVAMLEDHSQIGRPGRLRGTRELVIAHTSYIAIYSIRDETLRIRRIFHGARKRPRKL
jgi:toxin ParE1/3/4